ncbi:hypothetical protein HDU86_004439 [Geranomyces michiganensis]|nr:hypothetical protein HDU86_004439 [Geranomyces michiganensis]
MFVKSLSLAVAVAAVGVVAQDILIPTDLPFPIPTDITIPSVLPSNLPALPSGFPAVPTLPTSLPAVPVATASAAATRVASASTVSRSASRTSSASAPAATSTTVDCKAMSSTASGLFTGCLSTQLVKTPTVNSQTEADAAFQSVAKCVCNLFLPIQADFTRWQNQCPDPSTGKPATDAEKASTEKSFAACKANDYVTAASSFNLTMDSGGKKWTPTPPGGAAKSSAAGSLSSAAISLAGLAAAGLVLLA